MADLARYLLPIVISVGLVACVDDSDPWCTARAPLSIDCPGPYCVASIVVDYKRVEPRGYRVFTLDGTPIVADAEMTAEEKAQRQAIEYVQKTFGVPAPDAAEARRDLDFFDVFLYYTQSGDSYLVILHAPTGQLLFAGHEEWANAEKRGYDFPLPDGYQSADALGCAGMLHEPQDKQLIKTGEPMGSAPASEPIDALRVARRLNLTNRLIDDRPYEALVISYAPAVGEFDTESADWYVWLHRL